MDNITEYGPRIVTYGPRLFAVTARDSAMSPDIEPGDHVFIDPDEPVETDDIALVHVYGCGVVLRRLGRSGTRLRLEATDRREERIPLTKGGYDIIGKAVSVGRSL